MERRIGVPAQMADPFYRRIILESKIKLPALVSYPSTSSNINIKIPGQRLTRGYLVRGYVGTWYVSTWVRGFARMKRSEIDSSSPSAPRNDDACFINERGGMLWLK